MRLSLLLSLSLTLFIWQTADAQLAPADDFFNSGAQLYISNNIPAALERVELGLKTYPDDEKLKKLEQLLKQQQKQQRWTISPATMVRRWPWLIEKKEDRVVAAGVYHMVASLIRDRFRVRMKGGDGFMSVHI